MTENLQNRPKTAFLLKEIYILLIRKRVWRFGKVEGLQRAAWGNPAMREPGERNLSQSAIGKRAYREPPGTGPRCLDGDERRQEGQDPEPMTGRHAESGIGG